MTSRISKPGKQYLDFINRFPLLKIKNEAHLDDALKVVSDLCALDRNGKLTKDGEDYMSALTELIRIYEQEHYSFERLPPVEILKYLMEVNNLKQSDLSNLFSSRSNLSEILSGKRQISKEQARRLSNYFGLSTDAFIG